MLTYLYIWFGNALNTFSSNLAVDGALELGIQAVTAAGSDQSDGGAI